MRVSVNEIQNIQWANLIPCQENPNPSLEVLSACFLPGTSIRAGKLVLFESPAS